MKIKKNVSPKDKFKVVVLKNGHKVENSAIIYSCCRKSQKQGDTGDCD